MAFDELLTSAPCHALFETPALLQRMLDVEAALVGARADCGELGADQAAAVAAACQVADFDVAGLVREARRSGSLVVPLVEQLVKRVARRDPAAATQVHAGSTTQDIVDTAVVLATREALALIDADLGRLIDALVAVAQDHLAVPVLARTLMQPAAVQPFGWKALGWLKPLWRCRQAIRAAAADALVLQMGGPAGCFGVGNPSERAVAQALGRRLGLPVPEAAWHTQRDQWARLGCELAVLCGAGGKLARDWALMSQPEVGELSWRAEPGVGASSAMPHKRNPVDVLVGLAAALRAPLHAGGVLVGMGHEHERALGAWHVELAEWVALVQAAAGSVSALSSAAAGLTVDAERMRAHIDAQRGLVFSQASALLLATHVGRAEAQALVTAACDACRRTGRHLHPLLQEALSRTGPIPAALARALDNLFDLQALTAPMARHARQSIDAWAQAEGQAAQTKGSP